MGSPAGHRAGERVNHRRRRPAGKPAKPAPWMALDAQVPDAMLKEGPVDPGPGAQPTARRGFPRERLNDLVRRPRGGWIGRHVDAKNAPPLVRQHHEDEQDLAEDRRHREEVHRDQVPHVVVEKGSPGRRRRLPPARHVLRDGRFGYLDSQLEELAVDPRRTPHRVGVDDFPYEFANFRLNGRSPSSAPAAPSPIPAESCPMPSEDRSRHDDDQRFAPAPPNESSTHRARSTLVNRGRFTERRQTPSWWRRASISTAS
jgi:hypothetical protein